MSSWRLTGLVLLVLVLCTGVTAVFAAPLAVAATPTAEIEKLGGEVTFEENRPGKPVVGVSISGIALTDAAMECIGRLADLERLDLCGSRVTDAELAALGG